MSPAVFYKPGHQRIRIYVNPKEIAAYFQDEEKDARGWFPKRSTIVLKSGEKLALNDDIDTVRYHLEGQERRDLLDGLSAVLAAA